MAILSLLAGQDEAKCKGFTLTICIWMNMQEKQHTAHHDDAEPQVDVFLSSESAESRGRSTSSADENVAQELKLCRSKLEQLRQVQLSCITQIAAQCELYSRDRAQSRWSTPPQILMLRGL